MSKLNEALDRADAADGYETLRGRREMQRGREEWCDCCRAWVEKKSMDEHCETDDHVAAQLRADAWKM
jgi:hypothetical protein